MCISVTISPLLIIIVCIYPRNTKKTNFCCPVTENNDKEREEFYLLLLSYEREWIAGVSTVSVRIVRCSSKVVSDIIATNHIPNINQAVFTQA
jgi:hypothetical protein